jgi:molybdenum cofactor sulfurtransferase
VAGLAEERERERGEREMEQNKAQFGADYGYPDAPGGIDEMRATEFKRLESANSRLFLSYGAGATLFSEEQMADVAKDLTSNT